MMGMMTTRAGSRLARHAGITLLGSLLPLSALAEQPASTGAPQWLRDHFEELTAGQGRWQADNSAHRGDKEPWDAYGLEWTWGVGRQSVEGRLYGIAQGVEKTTFWEFRLVWHPGESTAILYQFGAWGALGYGPMTLGAGGVEELVQAFYEPDGRVWRHRHTSTAAGDERRTSSFDWVDGAWKADRTYLWRRSK